jgi:hypothetical protein
LRTKSVDVLNSADEATRKMDWILFKAEVDHIWHGDEEAGDWVPGIPLHKQVTSDWTGAENHPTAAKYRCKDCGVDWRGDEPCFVCGAVIEDTKKKLSTKDLYGVGFDGDTNLRALVGDMYGDMHILGAHPAGYLFEEQAADRFVMPRNDITVYSEFDIDLNRCRFRAESRQYNVFSELRIDAHDLMDMGRGSGQFIRRELLRDLDYRIQDARAQMAGFEDRTAMYRAYYEEAQRNRGNVFRYANADVWLTQQIFERTGRRA